MIRATRRFADDVGHCNACQRDLPEVTCIRVGSKAYSNETRYCDPCLADMLARAVTASKTVAQPTRALNGVDFEATKATKATKPQGAIAQAAKQRAAKPHVTPKIAKPFKAKKPKPVRATA